MNPIKASQYHRYNDMMMMATFTAEKISSFSSFLNDNDCSNSDCHNHPASTPTTTAAAILGVAAAVAAASAMSITAEMDEEDDATTAYSSWIEEDEDNSSLLSSCFTSCRSSRDTADDDEDDDVISAKGGEGGIMSHDEAADKQDDCLMAVTHNMSLSSSYYSAVTTQRSESPSMTANESMHGDHPQEVVVVASSSSSLRHAQRHSSKTKSTMTVAAPLLSFDSDVLSELTERAHRMLQREQLADYAIDDYFHEEGNDDDDCNNLTDAQDDNGTSTSNSPIDASCRSKMMEWSFRVVEYSFPHIAAAPLSSSSQPSTRKYSIQALHIVSQAFTLIDRFATLRLRQDDDERTMNRSEYKLVCMVCLHLVAKTCGLFGLYASDDGTDLAMEEDEENVSTTSNECPEQSVSLCKDAAASVSSQEDNDDDSCCYYLHQTSTSSLSLSSSLISHDDASSSTDVDDSSYHAKQEEGQTLPTPDDPVYFNQPLSRISDEPPKNISIEKNNGTTTSCCQQQPPRPSSTPSSSCCTSSSKQRRPPLNLLSLPGLSTLCQNEFSLEQLISMEWKVLQMLNWKLLDNGTCIDWCHVLLDLLSVVIGDGADNDDTAGNSISKMSNGHEKEMIRSVIIDMEEIWERTLVYLENAIMENIPLATSSPSLVAREAVMHALDECSMETTAELPFSIVISEYKKAVEGMLS